MSETHFTPPGFEATEASWDLIALTQSLSTTEIAAAAIGAFLVLTNLIVILALVLAPASGKQNARPGDHKQAPGVSAFARCRMP